MDFIRYLAIFGLVFIITTALTSFVLFLFCGAFSSQEVFFAVTTGATNGILFCIQNA